MLQLAKTATVMALTLALASCSGIAEKLTDVEVTTLEGKTQKLSDIRNGRVLVFKFGATWCGWCNKQLVDFNTVDKTYDDDKVIVLDIDVNEPAKKVADHAKSAGVTFTTVLDPKGAAAAKYNVSGIPVTLVVDHEGTILYRGNYTPFSVLKKHIDPAVAKLEASKKAK
ncbi:TlpA family protein disulfide reductase [bacterium]|nr:TlpA family protein disulfide reductase [bacterium]